MFNLNACIFSICTELLCSSFDRAPWWWGGTGLFCISFSAANFVLRVFFRQLSFLFYFFFEVEVTSRSRHKYFVCEVVSNAVIEDFGWCSDIIRGNTEPDVVDVNTVWGQRGGEKKKKKKTPGCILSGALSRFLLLHSFSTLGSSVRLGWIRPSGAPGGRSRWRGAAQTAIRRGSCEWARIGGRAGAHDGVRGPGGAEVAVGSQGGLHAVGVNLFGHGCRGDGVQEGLVGGVGHRSIGVAVQREARLGELHPGVAHLQEIVRGESVVAARFGHLEALQRKERGKEEGGKLRSESRKVQKRIEGWMFSPNRKEEMEDVDSGREAEESGINWGQCE